MSGSGKTITEELETEASPRVSVSVEENNERVVLSFDKDVSWLEMDPVTAIKVAEAMKEKAIEILRE